MAVPRLEAEIDRLYQLPLDQFTAARNALAKEGGAAVKQLVKPPLAAWAVNQLYWQERDEYDALVTAAEEERRAHAAVLAGRKADVRAAGRAHDAAVETALKAALALLERAEQPATDATRQAILTTLRALPADDPPGRLTRVLQPGGFEMLAGLSVGGRPRPPAPRKPEPEKPKKARPGKGERPDPKAVAQAREAVAAATRELRQAEHAARREEFDAARAAREAEKAVRRAEDARAAFEAARETLEEADAEVPPAERARESAGRRARQADAVLEQARARLDAAQAALKDLR